MIIVLGVMRVGRGDVTRLEETIAAQVGAARAIDGCLHYSFGREIGGHDTLNIAERWRDREAQAAHLASDHMVAFNIGMRAGKIEEAWLDAYEGGRVRKFLEVPARRFRGEEERRDMVIVMGSVKLAPGEIDRLAGQMRLQIEATRAEDGCEHYSYARDVLDPDTLLIAERWRDNDALTAHFQTPHMAAFNAALGSARIQAISVKAYDGDGVRTLIGE